MARGHAAVQKKLAELESDIRRLLDQPSSSIHDGVDGKVGFYQTARKLSFVKNLLTAEMDSHCGGGPEHLNHMAKRLSILEKTFVDRAIRDETLVNWVESGDGNAAVNKSSSDTSASCSCTESCVADEELVGEDNVNPEGKQFGASETETTLSEVSQVTERGRVESKEEGIEDEEENERNQEDEEVREQQQEAELVEERKVVVKEDAEERDRDCKEKIVNKVKVEATEEKGGWKHEGEMVEESKFDAEEDKGSERKEGAELGKDEEEIERNQERQMVGEFTVKVIDDDKQEETEEEGEMMGAPMSGRERNEEVEMQNNEVKEDEKGRERKQRSYKAKTCMAMGFAAAAGFAIALIGVAVANIFWVEETVYLVPT